MEVTRSAAVPLSDSTRIAEARRAALALGGRLGWSEEVSGRGALVTTELATNLVKHARDGVLVFNCIDAESSGRLQIVSVDRGPGMADPLRCFEDGYSTAGSPGTGLGAVRRLASAVDVYSTPGKGTVLVAEIAAAAGAERDHAGTRISVGGVCVPRQGESRSGDAWAVRRSGERLTLLLTDGLGHGIAAAEASETAVEAFARASPSELRGTLEIIHGALRSTRGAAGALALIDPAAAAVRFAGVGNIAGTLIRAGESRHLVSHNGTLGHAIARIAEFDYPWNPETTLVMHSDGVSGRWRADEWPGLWMRHPAVIAGVIYRDYCRGRDDATVAVARTT